MIPFILNGWYLSRIIGKLDFCIDENKVADQLRSKGQTDQRPCIFQITSKTPLLPTYEISSLQSSSVAVQLCLCRTW